MFALKKFLKYLVISFLASLVVIYSQDYPIQPAKESILAYITHAIMLCVLVIMYKDYLEKGKFNTSNLLMFSSAFIITFLSILLLPLITGTIYSNGYNLLTFIKTVEISFTVLNIGMFCYDNYFINIK